MFIVLTSSPDGAIFRYSLTSLELSKTLTLVKSTAVYERTLSGMITEKEINKFQIRNLYHINIHIFSAYLMVVSSLGAKKRYLAKNQNTERKPLYCVNSKKLTKSNFQSVFPMSRIIRISLIFFSLKIMLYQHIFI